MPARGIFGRTVKVRLVEISGDVGVKAGLEQNPVAAVIGIAPADSGFVADLLGDGVPVLFPLFPLAGAEDDDLAHGLMAEWPAVADALARRIKADGRDDLLLLADDETDGRLDVLASALAGTAISYRRGDDRSVGEAGTVLLLPGAGSAPSWISRLRRGTVLYGLAEDFAAHHSKLAGAGIRYRLAVQGTSVASLAVAAQLGVVEAHAVMASHLLRELLLSAGRDLRRTTLRAGFSTLRWQPEPGLILGYAAHPGSGTAIVEFISE